MEETLTNLDILQQIGIIGTILVTSLGFNIWLIKYILKRTEKDLSRIIDSHEKTISQIVSQCNIITDKMEKIDDRTKELQLLLKTKFET